LKGSITDKPNFPRKYPPFTYSSRAAPRNKL
jgi:hypothetical protein